MNASQLQLEISLFSYNMSVLFFLSQTPQCI